MKKSFFILAALFAATFAKAQITLLNEFQGILTKGINAAYEFRGNRDFNEQSPYLYNSLISSDDRVTYSLDLYNVVNFSLYRTINFTYPETVDRGEVCCSMISRNILTVDNKICFSVCQNNDVYANSYIYNEDGQLIASLKGSFPSLIKIQGTCYLLTTYRDRNYHYTTCIYSVPGNGDTEDVSEVPAPRQNARKYINQDQVLIETSDHTYTLTGQEVK